MAGVSARLASIVRQRGPSTGVDIFVALASLFTDRSAHHDLAMIGEISLRGLALPVWGIKEKVLAARNEKDLRKLPEVTRATLKFVFLETVDIRYTPLWVNGGQVAWVLV